MFNRTSVIVFTQFLYFLSLYIYLFLSARCLCFVASFEPFCVDGGLEGERKMRGRDEEIRNITDTEIFFIFLIIRVFWSFNNT
ncbi:hypothetical protein HanRHA438_Chr04g0176511 [Helianthus annuus]|nr:hypothetical protein HanRHA438_Chr04g0176511 [Helianthus annuus]